MFLLVFSFIYNLVIFINKQVGLRVFGLWSPSVINRSNMRVKLES